MDTGEHGFDWREYRMQADRETIAAQAAEIERLRREMSMMQQHHIPAGHVVVPEGEASDMFDAGWRMACVWANRDDLLHDMDSPQFKIEKEGIMIAASQEKPALARNVTAEEDAVLRAAASGKVISRGRFVPPQEKT